VRNRGTLGTSWSAAVSPANLGARASRRQIWERGRLAGKSGSAGVSPAKTNAGKMPALHKGTGLNAARESGSAGVSPAKTNAGKMPALHRGSGLNAARESGSAGVPPANHEGSEKPRERGLRFAKGSIPRPGVKRRAEDRLRRTRPVNGPLCSARVEVRRFSNKKDSYSAARSIISLRSCLKQIDTFPMVCLSDRNITPNPGHRPLLPMNSRRAGTYFYQ